MIEVAEAKRLVAEHVPVLGEETLPLEQAQGRVLAEPILADRDLPPADTSAMDGYAVQWEDVREPGAVLRIVGEVRAGASPHHVRVVPGSCVHILTGAQLPQGADTVVMAELSEQGPEAGTVRLFGHAERGQHIRRRGEDVRAGATVLSPGTSIGPAEIATLATVGRREVRVVRAPRVAVLATGDEVVPIEAAPAPHQVRNSNAWTLRAQLRELGLDAEDLGVARDTRGELEALLRRGLERDVLLVTGGVSVGRYDYVAQSLAALGVETVFHRVAVRPGKPVLFARHAGGLVFGLPGNPVSAFTGFAVFVAPALRRMMGHRNPEPPLWRARLGARFKRKPGRTHYHLAWIEWGEQTLRATPVRTMGSADVVSMTRANGFIVAPGGAHALEEGAWVDVLPWPGFGWR